ncbi:STAS domain-containing protein [Streptomyces sp. NPDC006333]|uniref:STAS domain-containing protein n=1 Tax=Streptomyces sp. NPDC006333 TaxID=3156753 RepID=UPI0033A893EA
MTEAEMRDTEQAQPAGGLTVFSTVSEDIRVLTLHGEIDHQTGGTLENALAAPAPPGPRVVADMHDVAFMDSTGINILIAAHRDLTEAGGWLRLAAPTTPVLRTIQLVGIDTLIACHETLDQARGL